MFSGIGSKILNSLGTFEDDDGAPKAEAQSAKPAVTAGAATTNKTSTVVPFAPAINQDMVDTLQKVIGKRPTSYTALVDAASKLSNVIPDENTRLKAAFAMIAAEGQRSLDGILQAIVVHQTDLDGELSRFKQATEQNIKAKVGALRNKAQQCDGVRQGTLNNIEILEKQIAQQRESVAANEREIIELTNKANADELEIHSVAQSFESAVAVVKQDLDNKKSQLASVLNS